MRMSLRGLAELAGHEGIVLSPYLDSVKVRTVGIGHTAAAGLPNPSKMTRPMEVGEILQIFRHDVERFADEVSAAIKAPIVQAQFDALVSFHYTPAPSRQRA